ncbi:MAG: L-seryl-tRNA(Sec) selenium transferase, partial [Clostridia bacterium]|nr:L-seryl-tRNA(Sec) selenium transferase [Clostridia bacterium]
NEIVESGHLNLECLIQKITSAIEEKNQKTLRKVINATGTILHTNLGRSLISEEIKAYIFDIAGHYSTLEYDTKEGKRGSRYSHVEKMITQLTKTESALVVNNNAAAMMLILSTVAKEKEVIVSRGELVEIGGSFRIPEIMEQSGAILKEVGTTNKTHLRDYIHALNEENIGALLKVHTSNYRILGFTEEVDLKDMVDLGKEKDIPVIYDLGSGALIDLKEYGIFDEPTVMESINTGVDICCFSGDKLLGGPQAGIIIGQKYWIDKMKKNPLTRAFRIDKLTLAALEGTLRLYQRDEAIDKIPTIKMMTMKKEETKQKAIQIYDSIKNLEDAEISLIEGFSQIGGGSVPLHELPSWMVQIKPKSISVNELEKALRNQELPIIARIYKDALLLDARTIEEEALAYVSKTVNKIFNNMEVNQ